MVSINQCCNKKTTIATEREKGTHVLTLCAMGEQDDGHSRKRHQPWNPCVTLDSRHTTTNQPSSSLFLLLSSHNSSMKTLLFVDVYIRRADMNHSLFNVVGILARN